jgi:Transglycosylase SLT domain
MSSARLLQSFRRSTGVFLRDVGNGLLEVSHNSLALLGLGVVAALIFVVGRPDLRRDIEKVAFDWLQSRHEARAEQSGDYLVGLAEPKAVVRATAADPTELPRQQAAVAQWLARRYRVAPEPISRIVQEAWRVGQRTDLDPTLILAIMAVESSFNPFAQSSVGAQGLMQVMTIVHDKKYVPFGGNHAAFDPVTNLRVGVQVLKDCIAQAGSLEAGLRHYVGAANLANDGGYASKVLGEQSNLKKVVDGKGVPVNAPIVPVPVPPARIATTPPVDSAPATPAPDSPPVSADRPAQDSATAEGPLALR